jgi:conjugative transposon TraN protein
MNTKLSESNGEPCTWRHVSTVRGQALENLPSKDGKALSAEPTHIIFPAAVRYVDLGSNHIIAGKADGAENVIRVKATTEGFPGETNFSVICEDGSFFSFNAKYAREPEMLNIEMKDFLENEDTSDFSHTRMNIHFRELAGESPLLVKLIMQSIYKNNDRKVRHLGSKRFGIQFLHL